MPSVDRPACGHPFRSCHTRVSPRGDTNDVITELSETRLTHNNIVPSHARSVSPIRAADPSPSLFQGKVLPACVTRALVVALPELASQVQPTFIEGKKVMHQLKGHVVDVYCRSRARNLESLRIHELNPSC